MRTFKEDYPICKNWLDTEGENNTYIEVCRNGYIHKKYLKWFNTYLKQCENKIDAFLELQLAQDWIETSRTDLKELPKWTKQLYWYELNQMYPPYEKRNIPNEKISLSGTINPNPNKYRMVNIMTNYVLKGVADLTEFVELEVTNAIDEEDAKAIATKELLATHPEYSGVVWDTIELVANAD